MRKQQVPAGTKSEQKALFKQAWAVVLPHLPHNYAAFTSLHFKKAGNEQDITHIYSVKKNGYEDWHILEYWVNEFVPAEVVVPCFTEREEVLAEA